MPAVVPILLRPTPKVSACFASQPSLAQVGNPAILEVRSESGSPMPQDKISQVTLLTSQEPPKAETITQDHPVLGRAVSDLNRTDPKGLFDTMVLWGHWSLGDNPPDRISQCAEWRRQYSKTFITYLGLNDDRPDYFQVRGIRGKVDCDLDGALSPLDDDDQVQVFLLRTSSATSSHQLLKMTPNIQQDLALWAAWYDHDRRISAPILQVTRSSYVKLAPLHSP
jgi:hypothetical protein